MDMVSLVIVMALAVASGPEVVEELNVDTVWAGHPVRFSLMTHQDKQFAAYYNADRDMVVAWRTLGETEWQRVTLPEKLAWDSHNSITMTVDDDGYLHLSGNMHVKPLVYFRTRDPLNPATFERAPMVGEREAKVTYPSFFRGPNNVLIFTYRDGKSGNGDQIFNQYDLAGKTWRRLLDQPLTSGGGKMNAYFNGPVLGPDGRFHLCWVWRDHFGCESNHDLSYAQSDDLVHWHTSAGQPLVLPITLQTAEIVDPVPAGGGMLNGNTKLGFDSQQRPVISYHKFDAQGNTQIYQARLEDKKWHIYQTSDWHYRWEFSGGGTIIAEIGLSGVEPCAPGRIKQSYHHAKEGSSTWLLDEATLKPVSTLEETPELPKELAKVHSSFPGMSIRRANDLGKSPEPDTRYILQWETLRANRDKPREGALPESSPLRLIKVKTVK